MKCEMCGDRTATAECIFSGILRMFLCPKCVAWCAESLSEQTRLKMRIEPIDEGGNNDVC